jgi:hypothetical protein
VADWYLIHIGRLVHGDATTLLALGDDALDVTL